MKRTLVANWQQTIEATEMSDGVSFKWGAISIKGNFRDNNEDNFYVDPQSRYFLVADGMGGQSAGEKASELAVELVSKKLDLTVAWGENPQAKTITECIDSAVEHANAEIMALGEIEPAFKSMGTTVTFVVVVDQQFYIGGVGDSRTYQLRDGILKQLTEDHSLTQALVKAGTITAEDALTHRYKNVLYRYLGSKDGAAGTESKKVTPQAGDRFMLCSDGVTDGATDDVIHRILAEEDDPQEAADALVKAAQDGGSKDNITCIVVYVDEK